MVIIFEEGALKHCRRRERNKTTWTNSVRASQNLKWSKTTLTTHNGNMPFVFASCYNLQNFTVSIRPETTWMEMDLIWPNRIWQRLLMNFNVPLSRVTEPLQSTSCRSALVHTDHRLWLVFKWLLIKKNETPVSLWVWINKGWLHPFKAERNI